MYKGIGFVLKEPSSEAVERTEQSLQEALRRRHEGQLGRIDLSSAVSYVLEPDGELSDLDLEESEDESDPLFEPAEEGHDGHCEDSDDEYDLPLIRIAKSHMKPEANLEESSSTREGHQSERTHSKSRLFVGDFNCLLPEVFRLGHDKQSCRRDKPICLTTKRLGAEMHI
ncbi:hypothetical protein QYM36_007684 [Artemia franciscana]|uniref:Uncharacterized protein n=1 Tax=Artemia franciscana TaxID=6661 RepID=A0AA88IE14_ARTSF|nr:hypothetical protein QYM36_007684 [Artemia franciscana]